jgi:hypothetical protein
LGAQASANITKKLAALLADGEPDAAGLVQSAVEECAQQLTRVIRSFLRAEEWRDTQCLVIGGGFGPSRIGELTTRPKASASTSSFTRSSWAHRCVLRLPVSSKRISGRHFSARRRVPHGVVG